MGCNSALKWQCKGGHIWETTPEKIKMGSWCQKCSIIENAKKRRSTIERMRKIAEERGGKCLSDVYVNNDTKIKWQCTKGHIWNATPASVKQGSWCPKCAKNKLRSPRKYNRNYKKFLHKHVF